MSIQSLYVVTIMLLIRNIECKKIKKPIKRELFLAFLSLVLCSPIFSTENCLYYIILIIAGMGIDGALIGHGHKTEINRIVSTIVVTELFLSIIKGISKNSFSRS